MVRGSDTGGDRSDLWVGLVVVVLIFSCLLGFAFLYEGGQHFSQFLLSGVFGATLDGPWGSLFHPTVPGKRKRSQTISKTSPQNSLFSSLSLVRNLRNLIDMAAKEVRLTNVTLMFDFSEIYRRRTPTEAANALQALKDSCHKQRIEFAWTALKAGALMHAKAYALLQYMAGELEDGYIWVTSGNATQRRLGLETPKFEISSVTDKLSDLKTFIRIWELLKTDYSANIDKPGAAANEYGFVYGLLASGIFLHKWSMALSAQLALRYVMTVNGREKANQVPDELKKLGFELEASTLTRQPLHFKATKVLPRAFIRTYTLDTRLGRWCPRPVWDVVSQSIQQDSAFKTFVDNFRQRTDDSRRSRLVKTEHKRDLPPAARLPRPEAGQHRAGDSLPDPPAAPGSTHQGGCHPRALA